LVDWPQEFWGCAPDRSGAQIAGNTDSEAWRDNFTGSINST
jgi:hypothetical protein